MHLRTWFYVLLSASTCIASLSGCSGGGAGSVVPELHSRILKGSPTPDPSPTDGGTPTNGPPTPIPQPPPPPTPPPTPRPTPTPFPSCLQPKSGGSTVIDGKGNTVNGLTAGNKDLQSLMATLSNNGVEITAQAASLPAHTAATAQGIGTSSGVIQFDPNQMNTAESQGQDPSQILYHELDHIYYETQPGFFPDMPSTATYTIGGVTYDYNTANIPTSTAGVETNSKGEMAWEHDLIHNDIVSAFGSDSTQALAEGLLYATNPPSNVQQTAANEKGMQGTSSHTLTPPSRTATCKSASTSRRSVSTTTTTYVDSGLTIGY
jgi:hypothetical protein